MSATTRIRQRPFPADGFMQLVEIEIDPAVHVIHLEATDPTIFEPHAGGAAVFGHHGHEVHPPHFVCKPPPRVAERIDMRDNRGSDRGAKETTSDTNDTAGRHGQRWT
jgi:hypothetical protein